MSSDVAYDGWYTAIPADVMRRRRVVRRYCCGLITYTVPSSRSAWGRPSDALLDADGSGVGRMGSWMLILCGIRPGSDPRRILGQSVRCRTCRQMGNVGMSSDGTSGAT